MQIVERFVTSDGVEHQTERYARNYCDEKLGAILVGHARKLCLIDKFQDCLAYLELHLPSFAEAARWKQERDEPLDCDEEIPF